MIFFFFYISSFIFSYIFEEEGGEGKLKEKERGEKF